MPTVPRTRGPTVTLTNAPDVRRNVAFDDRGSRALASATQSVAGLVSVIAKQEQEKADEAALLEARNDLAAWEQSWFDPGNERGVYAYRGRRAIELPEKVMGDLQERVSAIDHGLQRRQKAAWRRMAAGFSEGVQSRLSSYTVREYDGYVQETERASLQNIAQRAATAARERRLDDMSAELESGYRQLAAQASRQGMGEESLQLQRDAFLSATLGAAVEGMIEVGDFRGAVSFYQSNAQDMTEADRRRLDNTVRNAGLLIEQTDRANEIMATHGTGQAAVRAAQSISDPVLRDRVIGEIDAQAARQERAAREGERALVAQAYDALGRSDPSTPLEQAVPPAVLARMDPKAVLALENFQNRRLSGTATRTDPRLFERLSVMEPQDLLGQDVVRLHMEGQLSVSDMEHFQRRQDEIRNPKPGAETLSQTRSEIIGEAFRTLGIDRGRNAQERQGLFRQRYIEAEREAERSKGGRLTREEMLDLSNRLMLEVSRTRRGWFWDSTEVRPAYLVPEDELEGFGVPQGARAEILESFRRNGIDSPTEEQVRSVYLRSAEHFNRQRNR